MNELLELRQLAGQMDMQQAVSLYNKVNKEIERLSRTLTDYDELLMQKNNIIDRAKEFIEKNYFKAGRIKELYEILDKEIK